MEEEEIQVLMQFLKTLADKTRLCIVGLIAVQERSVEELADLLGIKPPSVSHHLNKLKECGLVSMRPEGTAHLYSLNEGHLALLLRGLSPKSLRDVSEDLDTTVFERKVLQSFFVDGKLIQIPVQRKKREVILRKLIEEFEYDRKYTEREVNGVLGHFNEDTSTLRREFIGYRLMGREDNIYWRLNTSIDNETAFDVGNVGQDIGL